jgi:integrase
MARPRTGSAFFKDGKIVIQIRRRCPPPPLKAPPPLVFDCPPRADGKPLDLLYAKSRALDLQREYDAGTWDPDAPDLEPQAQAPTPATRTFFAYVEAWGKKLAYESAPKDRTTIARRLKGCPAADLSVTDLRPRHGIELVQYLKGLPSERGGTLGWNAVVSTFNLAERALDQAVLDQLLPANPLRMDAVHKVLPERKDKVAGARARWRFTPEEIHHLTHWHQLLPDRRVLYALVFWTGARPGELRALRVHDLDFDAQPLGRITLARAIKSVSRVEGETKTGAIKEVPMLPLLHAALRAWLEFGWPALMGRGCKPTDLVIPSVRGRCKGAPRNDVTANRAFKEDQKLLGFANPRHLYCARHTLVRLLRDAGASRDVVRWATHAPPKSVYDGYADAPAWEVLCAEFAKVLRLLGQGGSGGFARGFAPPQTIPAQNTNEIKPAERKHRRIEAPGVVPQASDPVGNRSETSDPPSDTIGPLETPPDRSARGFATTRAIPPDVLAYELALLDLRDAPLWDWAATRLLDEIEAGQSAEVTTPGN